METDYIYRRGPGAMTERRRAGVDFAALVDDYRDRLRVVTGALAGKPPH